jgi:hypothetical protein
MVVLLLHTCAACCMQKSVHLLSHSSACSNDKPYVCNTRGLPSNVAGTYTAAGNTNPAPGEYNVSLNVTHKHASAASLQGRESHGEQQQQQLQQQLLRL